MFSEECPNCGSKKTTQHPVCCLFWGCKECGCKFLLEGLPSYMVEKIYRAFLEQKYGGFFL